MMLRIHITNSRTISVTSLTALRGTIGAATTISNTAGGYEESPWSLEATVYALFHDGEYPDLVENEMNFIRPLDKSVLPTLDILNKLCNTKPDDSFRPLGKGN